MVASSHCLAFVSVVFFPLTFDEDPPNSSSNWSECDKTRSDLIGWTLTEAAISLILIGLWVEQIKRHTGHEPTTMTKVFFMIHRCK